jgi:hypothetical protein
MYQYIQNIQINILKKQALSGSNILADPLIYQGSCHPGHQAERLFHSFHSTLPQWEHLLTIEVLSVSIIPLYPSDQTQPKSPNLSNGNKRPRCVLDLNQLPSDSESEGRPLVHPTHVRKRPKEQ